MRFFMKKLKFLAYVSPNSAKGFLNSSASTTLKYVTSQKKKNNNSLAKVATVLGIM